MGMKMLHSQKMCTNLTICSVCVSFSSKKTTAKRFSKVLIQAELCGVLLPLRISWPKHLLVLSTCRSKVCELYMKQIRVETDWKFLAIRKNEILKLSSNREAGLNMDLE